MKLIDKDGKEIKEEEKKWDEPARYLISVAEAEKMNLVPLRNVFSAKDKNGYFQVYIFSLDRNKVKAFDDFKNKRDVYADVWQKGLGIDSWNLRNGAHLETFLNRNDIKNYKIDSKHLGWLGDFTTVEDIEKIIEKERISDEQLKKARDKYKAEYEHDKEIATKLINF